MRSILIAHAQSYPEMEPQDAVKLLYQCEFGAGHMVEDPARSLALLEEELAGLGKTNGPMLESIGGGLFRLHLRALPLPGWTLEQVNAWFVHGANIQHGDWARMEIHLEVLRQLTREGGMPFSSDALTAFEAAWRSEGCPVVRHSAHYRAMYGPAYRVVPGAHFALMDALAQRQGQRTVLAIDGNSGSGKSTLAGLLQAVFGANLAHMDDFFLPMQRKTPERLAEPGGNVDYERALAELILPLLAGQAVVYRPFDCQTGTLKAPAPLGTSWLTVVEGVYSLHPALRRGYDVTAFLRLTGDAQRQRILARNGPVMLERFVKEWIPMENHYFDALGIAESCDFVFDAQDSIY